MTNLIAYLNFPGNAAEAMAYYHSIFGGELQVATFAEFKVVPQDHPNAGNTMHSQLITPSLRLMGADAIPGLGPDVTYGDSVNLALVGPERELLTEYFNKLAEGGTVQTPLAEQMWGDVYGAVVDRFNVAWMVNIEVAAPQS